MMRTLHRFRFVIATALITLSFFGLQPAVAHAADEQPAATAGQPCRPSENAPNFLGLPTWYQYLNGRYDGGKPAKCVPQLNSRTGDDDTEIIDYASVWLIGLAVVEILLRIAGFVTVGIVIFGGFKYITSQGSPDATKSARMTIINAFVGMVIAIVSSVSVNFLAKLLQGNAEKEIGLPKANLSTGPDSVIERVLSFTFGAAGAIAFIVIIVSGLRYTLSRGNPDNVKKSKEAIIYAIVGLIIAMSGYGIVTFVFQGLK